LDRAGLVEQALFFTIGFLAACLAAVVGVPAVSRRATRLSEARARFRAPASEKQAISERDALRAQNAVEHVRLNRRLALAEDASNQLRVAVGRLSAKVLALETTSSERMNVIVDQRAEISQAEFDRLDLEVGLGASQIALNDAFAQRDRAINAETAATSRQIELEAQASRDRARIAILAARGENTEGRFEDLSREARRLESRLGDAILQNERLRESMSRSIASLNENRRRLTELESRLALSEQAREDALLETGRQLAALAERAAAVKTARATAFELETRLAALAASAHGPAQQASAQTSAFAHALAEESFHAARADLETPDRESEAVQAGIVASAVSDANADDDAALREAIDRLGREVTRLFAVRKSADQREDLGSGVRPSFGRRKASALGEPSGDERHAYADGTARRVARTLAPDP
jgi:hypothetical protein